MSQENRPFRVKTSLAEDALMLESFQGVERISTPFHFTLRVLSKDPDIDMKAQLRGPIVLNISLENGEERFIHGNISRMRLLDTGEDGMAAYEIEMVAWPWFLNLFTNCRIFQNKSVPDILQAVFKERGFNDFRLNLQGTYNPRVYCVQYRETDFNFVSRLMEEEGIFYFFEQTKEKHIMVLGDKNTSFKTCVNMPKARFTTSLGGSAEDETIRHIEQELRVHVGRASLSDYNFETPNTKLYTTIAGEQKGEHYDFPGRYLNKADGDRYALIRLEEQEVSLVTVFGESNCRGFECGYKFTLEEHFRSETNREYALIAIKHDARNPSYRSGREEPLHYTNRFDSVPSDVKFRPPRLARKPIVEGAQTAVVVGKSGEEIWPDKYGRVIVQFPWDREGQNNEKSSCFVRVTQSWAGKQWGAVVLPRIGQEVIVSFLEGDPDQPIITGRVYNAEQMPPYKLPDEQTKSTMKSMSSKGGGGFNEFRFEDKKGSEQVFMHGEKDLDVRIKHDAKEWIGNDTHAIVTQHQFEKVGGNLHLKVTGDQNEKVDGDVSIEAGVNIHQKAGTKVAVEAGSEVHIKSGMTLVIESGTALTLKVGGNFISIDPSGVTILGTLVKINSGGAAGSGSGASPHPPDPPKEADKADPGTASSPPPAASSYSPAALTLKQAAVSGTPFCAICAKNAAARH